jgi:hypothetical protein
MDDFGSSSSDSGSRSFSGSSSDSWSRDSSASEHLTGPQGPQGRNDHPALKRLGGASVPIDDNGTTRSLKMSFANPVGHSERMQVMQAASSKKDDEPETRNHGARFETYKDGVYTGFDLDTMESWSSRESRLDESRKIAQEKHRRQLQHEQTSTYLNMRKQHEQLMAGFTSSTKDELPTRKASSKRLLPLWRYFSHAAPEGMVLNPDRDRTRDYLTRNVHRVLWRMLTAALGGFFLSMLGKLVLNVFADPSTMVEDALFPIAAAFVFWRGLSSDWHKEARSLQATNDSARYVAIPEPEERPALQSVVKGHLEHIEALALPNLDIEMENAARDLAKSIKAWSKAHEDPVGSQTKREMHMIRTVSEAARDIQEKPGLRKSMEARSELIDVMKSAATHLQEQTRQAGASETTDFKSGLRALKSQMGLPSRKK